MWIAYTDAKSVAAQQAQWKTLADQVVLRHPAAIGEAGFQALMKDVGGVVRSTEERSDVAMSYALTPAHVRGADFGRFDALALANQRWLDLMLKDAAPGAVEAIGSTRCRPGSPTT
ncbi:hypothetical protein [Allorhizocola rhizosphaerae]|uniref:hypothetical protein n=1 Tax=Allorhizocola rhizosphaerae TaxID=1872709 RepID=UPI000E3B8E4A|nr:hypothetical protein [Allorhizocola rhizosphaerae]